MSQSFRVSWRSAALLLITGGLCLAGTAGAQSNQQDTTSQSAAEGSSQPREYLKFVDKPDGQTARKSVEALRARLRKHVEIDMTGGVPISVVREQLQQALGCTVLLDFAELNIVGISPDTALIDTALRDVQLDTALRYLLPQVGMGYYIEGGMLILTSQELAETQLVNHVYDCRDLYQAEASYKASFKARFSSDDSAKAADDAPSENKIGLGANGTGVVIANPFPSRYPDDNLIDVITTSTGTTGDDGWLDDGTGAGTILSFSGHLVVSQTNAVHDEIDELLTMLRASLASEEANAAEDSAAATGR